MKMIKWKIFLITALVCLLPMLLGISLWDRLPETMAIHFNVYGEPDGFATRGFTVFGLPCIMVVLQFICCIIFDLNAKTKGERKKFERVTKWIIPVMTMVLQIAILGYGLGWQLDMRTVAALVVGGILLTVGNYLPKFDDIKHYDLDTEKARKINRFIGFETVIMGLLFLISVLLPPMATLVCILLLIPYALIGVIYGIVVGKSKDV